MMNTFPYNTGHLMVVPFRHLADPLDLAPQESSELLYGIRIAMEALRNAFSPEGFNLGMNVGHVAGAGFADHMHMHVVSPLERRHELHGSDRRHTGCPGIAYGDLSTAPRVAGAAEPGRVPARIRTPSAESLR